LIGIVLTGADVIEMPRNGVKAAAMMAGFSRARELGCGCAIMLDGDGQHNPKEIPAVAAPVLAGEADLVIGPRFLDIKADIPTYRVIGQKVLNSFTTFSSGRKTTDSQSGYRALGKRALDNLSFSSEGHNIESDIISHFANLGLTITETPISVTYDVPHKHKAYPLNHGFGVLAKIIGLIGYRRPLIFFGIPGFILATTGIITAIYTFALLYRTSQFHYIFFTGSITALFLGLLLITTGLILNSLVIIMKETRDLTKGDVR
jgi:glycosyltransferase involved in cell wall biosynthesis